MEGQTGRGRGGGEREKGRVGGRGREGWVEGGGRETNMYFHALQADVFTFR